MTNALLDEAVADRPAAVAPSNRARLRRRVNLFSVLLALVGILLTAGVAERVRSTPGVYWSEVRVVLLAPPSQTNQNTLQTSSSSLIALAGVLARNVGSSTPVNAVSDSVTLVGEGVRHGYRVRLPDSGGQWATNFDQQLVDVQAAGPTVADVSKTMNDVLARISRELTSLQTSLGVDKFNWISSTQSPPTVPIYYQRGSRTRALGATLILGFGLTLALIVGVRRRWLVSSPAA